MDCILCKIFPFFRRPVSVNPTPQDGQLEDRNLIFDAHSAAVYQQSWIRSQQPDPGAAAYGFNTVALMPFYPINRFGQVQTPMRACEGPQLWSLPSAIAIELPQPNGQMIMQPLYDPNAIPGDE